MSSDLYPPPDLLDERYSWTAEALLDDPDYKQRYESILSGLLEKVSFKKGTWYTNMWPACRVKAKHPSVLVLGRATRNQWGERLDRPDFSVELAIQSAARKNMEWVDCVRSQYMRTAIALVDALPQELRNHDGSASLDISWSDLYKVARAGNPTAKEMSIQGAFGNRELLTREVEVLKPKLVLAFTQSYSRKTHTVKDGWFEDIMGQCSKPENSDGIAWTTRVAGVPCIVFPHPQGGPARRKFIEDAKHALRTFAQAPS